MRRSSAARSAALLAALVLATATAALTSISAAADEGDSTAIVIADTDDTPTVDDIRSLVAQFEATGEVTFAGARRMEIALRLTEHYINTGRLSSAIHSLELFKQVASDPGYVPSAAASEELVAAADQLIAQLSS